MSSEIIPHSVLLVFYDNNLQSFQLSKRPNGQIYFPSEKGCGDVKDTITRGIREEMGCDVIDPQITVLPYPFQYTIGDFGSGLVHISLIDEWKGNIVNKEPEKDLFFWVKLEEVMDTLSLEESKYAYLIVLFELMRKAKIDSGILLKEFAKAPKLN